MNKLHPTLVQKIKNLSGICHHMMFETQFIKELFALVEDEDKRPGKPFYQIFLENVDSKHKLLSGASEYEIYFNYMLVHQRDKMFVRPLKWANVSRYTTKGGFDYISCHWFMRNQLFLKIR